jgi:hypothetical protein
MLGGDACYLQQQPSASNSARRPVSYQQSGHGHTMKQYAVMHDAQQRDCCPLRLAAAKQPCLLSIIRCVQVGPQWLKQSSPSALAMS